MEHSNRLLSNYKSEYTEMEYLNNAQENKILKVQCSLLTKKRF